MSHISDDRPVVIVERSAGIGAFLLGGLLGAAAALLLAPMSGEQARRALRERGQRLRERTRETADEWSERVEDGYERAKERLEEGLDSVRRNLRETREGAGDALDAGKAAVTSARSELERRLADSRSRRKATADETAE